jgi:hypothetical protein
MRIREALKILEAASVECERHGIDTPDVRAALERRTGKPAGALGLNIGRAASNLRPAVINSRRQENGPRDD